MGDFTSTFLLELAGGLALVGVILLMSRGFLPAWREQRLRAQSRHWPAIKARLDHACVTEYRPSDTTITFRLDAWFTYTVNGQVFEGSYSDEDMRLDDAKWLLKRLNHDPVMITYNPNKPAEYYYRPPRQKSA